MTRYALARRASVPGLTVGQFAAGTGLHPHLVNWLLALGCSTPGRTGPVRLPVMQVDRAARVVLLRAGLGLSYTAVGAVLNLLDRIDQLQAALRARPDGHRR